MMPPIDQTLWNAGQSNRGPYDSLFAPRPDMTGPVGPNGMGFGAPGISNMPMYGGPQALPPGAMRPQGLLNMAGAQQQQGVPPGILSLTPQMIQQILAQRAAQMPQQPTVPPVQGPDLSMLDRGNAARVMGNGTTIR